MGSLLKQVNQLLRQANLPGQFPLLVGYYHSGLKNLILVSAGLNGTLNTGSIKFRLVMAFLWGRWVMLILTKLANAAPRGSAKFGGWRSFTLNVVCRMSNCVYI